MSYQSESEKRWLSGPDLGCRKISHSSWGSSGGVGTETSRFFHPHSRSAYKWWCLCFFVSEDNDSKKVAGTVPDSAGIKLEFSPWILLLYNWNSTKTLEMLVSTSSVLYWQFLLLHYFPPKNSNICRILLFYALNLNSCLCKILLLSLDLNNFKDFFFS